MSLLNTFLRAEMEAEVRRRMANGDSFTAYDISRAVQAQGVTERHRHLKTAVHELYERGGMPGYARRQVALANGEQPFLYYPKRPQPGVNHFAVARTRQTSIQVRRPDAWNRLRLPAKALREAGFAPGSAAWVQLDVQRGFVMVGSDPKSGDRLYRIDCYGNLRLALGRAQAAAAASFAIAFQQGSVTATAQ